MPPIHTEKSFLTIVNQNQHFYCNYNFPIDLAPNVIAFGAKSIGNLSETRFRKYNLWKKIKNIYRKKTRFRNIIYIPNKFLFIFKLNEIWSWWQFSSRIWTKWNSICLITTYIFIITHIIIKLSKIYEYISCFCGSFYKRRHAKQTSDVCL